MKKNCHGPRRERDGIHAPHAVAVEQHTAEGIADGKRHEKSSNDVGILHCPEVQFLSQRLREHGERLPVEVVIDRHKKQQADNQPAVAMPKKKHKMNL